MEKIKLEGVPETMLQTLYARAAYSQKPNHKFYDAKSIEIVSQMDYDFSKAEKDAAMSAGVIARTLLLDRMVGDFVRENPSGTVINLACGLDTRVYRVDNGRIRWYNIDLPETIRVRRRFFEENGRIAMLAKSAMDETWAEQIEPPAGKTLVVIEGLTMYLSEPDVKQILRIIGRRFAEARVVAEGMNPWIADHIKEKSIEATTAKFTWGVRSGRELAALAPEFRWVEDVSLVEGMKELYPVYRLFGWIPAVKNISNKLMVLQKG